MRHTSQSCLLADLILNVWKGTLAALQLFLKRIMRSVHNMGLFVEGHEEPREFAPHIQEVGSTSEAWVFELWTFESWEWF